MIPTVHYNMGGIPTNYKGEVLTLGKDGTPDAVVPGFSPPARRLRLGARREPPRRQLAARHRRLRPRVRQHRGGDAQARASRTSRSPRTRASTRSRTWTTVRNSSGEHTTASCARRCSA